MLLDFGPQPPSNRYERAGAGHTETHPLVVGQCDACGLVQLVAPMAPEMVRSRFEWLTYNEPEGHLDDLVARLCKLPGLDHEARIVGLTYKDDTTVRRFNRLGFTNTYRYDAGADLAPRDLSGAVQSIPTMLNPAAASRMVAKHGVADLLLVRHVLEHAYDPNAFLSVLRGLVRPGGYLLFEMPDCTKFIKGCDYSFIWEEHITYFASQTLAGFLSDANLVLQETVVYPYPLEDSLIGVVRNEVRTGAARSVPPGLGSIRAGGDVFSKRYPDTCARLQALLGEWRQKGKRIAIFGAGHLAAKFVNLYSVGELIECIIDEHPGKQGLLMPGSRLPIRDAAALAHIDLCLLGLSPESEQKVMAKHGAFLDRGGRFLSIFALNPNSVYQVTAV
jgi:SAM-dependent methyltransferase